jgi:ubiquitin C-terminal hydrolase
MNPLFEGIAANDAKDLVNFIIMTLHLELNKIIKVNENQIDGIIDQTNKELIKQIFKEDFDKKNNSIISKLFYATNYNITQCINCKNIIYNFQTYFFINFPLEEVRKYKIEIMNNQQNNIINNIQNQFNFIMNPFNNFNMLQQNQFMVNQQILMNNNIKEVNISECFDYDQKINYMSGQNQMYCNFCRNNTNSYMKTNLYTGPEVLILILNRGKGIEFDVKIYFTEELNLSKYIENKESGYMYKLIGVITHLGESSMSGHFIAYCKDPLNGKWFKYNDAIVDEVNDFKKEVIDFAMPYLLFYEKIKNPI